VTALQFDRPIALEARDARRERRSQAVDVHHQARVAGVQLLPDAQRHATELQIGQVPAAHLHGHVQQPFRVVGLDEETRHVSLAVDHHVRHGHARGRVHKTAHVHVDGHASGPQFVVAHPEEVVETRHVLDGGHEIDAGPEHAPFRGRATTAALAYGRQQRRFDARNVVALDRRARLNDRRVHRLQIRLQQYHLGVMHGYEP